MWYVVDLDSGEKIYKHDDENQVDKFITRCISEGKNVTKEEVKTFME